MQAGDHLTLTWKVAGNVLQHIDVREERKENVFSLGKCLWIGAEVCYTCTLTHSTLHYTHLQIHSITHYTTHTTHTYYATHTIHIHVIHSTHTLHYTYTLHYTVHKLLFEVLDTVLSGLLEKQLLIRTVPRWVEPIALWFDSDSAVCYFSSTILLPIYNLYIY